MGFLPHDGGEASKCREKLAEETALTVWQVWPPAWGSVAWERSPSPPCALPVPLTYQAPTQKGHAAVLKLTHAQGITHLLPSLGKLINSEKA